MQRGGLQHKLVHQSLRRRPCTIPAGHLQLCTGHQFAGCTGKCCRNKDPLLPLVDSDWVDSVGDLSDFYLVSHHLVSYLNILQIWPADGFLIMSSPLSHVDATAPIRAAYLEIQTKNIGFSSFLGFKESAQQLVEKMTWIYLMTVLPTNAKASQMSMLIGPS